MLFYRVKSWRNRINLEGSIKQIPLLLTRTSLPGVFGEANSKLLPFKPEFFSGFLFATALVAEITAMLFPSFNLPVQIYDFIYSYPFKTAL